MRYLVHQGLICAFSVGALNSASAYPTDKKSSERTEIRRLAWQRDIDAKKVKGAATAPGGRLAASAISLRMTSNPDFRVTDKTAKDPGLQKGLDAIVSKNHWGQYGVAILDMTDPARPRFAGNHEAVQQTPGSVAKLLVAVGLLKALKAQIGPDIAKREAVLKEVKVQADAWLMPNSHQVPVVNKDSVAVRAVRHGDRFSLWEWMDHAISPSSNAAGTLVWREAILLSLLGEAYPPKTWNAALFSKWDRETFTRAAYEAVDGAQREAGLDPDDFRLRTFFTRGASKHMKSSNSRTSPRALVAFMLAVEQGRMVDTFSSLELKRLMYVTRRRVRYAHAKELADSAVYFKSGSLFKCKSEPGFTCAKYQGNSVNVLNSITVVESPDGAAVYMVAVMSNVLKRNAANEHARLAGEIHGLLTAKE